jgi:hypothetical protein
MFRLQLRSARVAAGGFHPILLLEAQMSQRDADLKRILAAFGRSFQFAHRVVELAFSGQLNDLGERAYFGGALLCLVRALIGLVRTLYREERHRASTVRLSRRR